MKIQSLIFKIYIFMLPFMMLFPFFIPFRDFFSSAASLQNNFFVLIVGLILFFMTNKGVIPFPKNSLVVNGIKLCIVLNIISFITSLVLYIPFGELHGENTLKASFPNIIYMFLTAIAFYYNAMMFQIVEKKIIIKILNFLSIILLFIGSLQLLVLIFPNLSKVYDIINFTNIIRDSYFLLKDGRICFSGSEPASVGCIVTIFILPYLLSQVLYTGIFKYKLYSLLFIFLCFFTYSSTVYVGLVVNTIVFIFLYLKKCQNKKSISILIIILCILSLFLVLFGKYIWNNTVVGQKMQEILIQKTTSQENLSTLVRYSVVKMDLQAFLHYPLTGVGNGNQGYFYNETIDKSILPAYALQYSEFYKNIDGDNGILAGGAFTSSFISGYGLLGIFFLLIFVRKCVLYISDNPEEYGCFRYMYYIGGITFIIVTTVSGGLNGNFISIFVVSIPFMQKLFNKNKC